MALTLEELKARVGEPWPALSYSLDESLVRRFTAAVGDANPRWRTEVPPTLLPTLGFEQVVDELLKLPGAVLHGSTELTCHRVVRVGEVVRVTPQVASLRERGGLAFLTFTLTYHNAEGELAAECRQLALLGAGA